ncbi:MULTISPECIES: hypothetical protein [Sphingobium]|jgi:hypothetical protein|uniref:Uncharacterized protein n=1 Tax=Sphingobium limneticum TaxID=1007511 RepID=A0A5J5HNU9_9SPHN|nr:MULTISPECIES: hypothetical protein [Sphingobium]KAA9009692.1 hypothetical protein F4U96_24520 [Sphingobium limneticum]KAA9022494.1 hypothetical protein F4U95_24380 [Sphingobium limneticum]MBJ7375543.1 hypothetical protein [Sphingobium sp.]
MKSQDIVILLKLAALRDQEESGRLGSGDDQFDPAELYSVRGLGNALGISKTEVSASLNRSLQSGLAVKDRSYRRVKPNRRDLCEFIAHGLKFVFPAVPAAPERGIATGFAAPMLQGQLISAGQEIYVWPYAHGNARGPAVEPLFKSVPAASQQDERLYEYLALVDAVRLGRQRESNLAIDRLRGGLLKQ